MANISTAKDIRREIAQKGYCLLRASDLHVSDELRQSWLSLTIDYADLPADEYLPGGARYRFPALWPLPILTERWRAFSLAT